MADILTFPLPAFPPERRSAATMAPASKAPGEVVIFPGIRYEYQSSETARPKTARRPKRDLMEIEG